MISSEREGKTPVINVRIPPVLRDAVGGVRQLEVDGATVGEALDDLFARFPAVRDRLTTDGQLSPFLNVYVNADDVRHRDGLATVLRDADTVILLPAMAGGSEPSARAKSSTACPADVIGKMLRLDQSKPVWGTELQERASDVQRQFGCYASWAKRPASQSR